MLILMYIQSKFKEGKEQVLGKTVKKKNKENDICFKGCGATIDMQLKRKRDKFGLCPSNLTAFATPDKQNKEQYL